MLSPKFVVSFVVVISAIVLDHAVQSEPSPTRQRSSSATTADDSNFAVSSANGNPGTVRKTVTKDGVTIESDSKYVSPDGKSRSSSRSSSTTSTSGGPNGRNRTAYGKQAATKVPMPANPGSPRTAKRTTVESTSDFGRGSSPARAQTAAAAAAARNNGQNFASTTANGTPGTVKRTVTKDGVIVESTMEQVSPDGSSRSYSKSFSSTKNNRT